MNGIGGDSFGLIGMPDASGSHDVAAIDGSGPAGARVRRENAELTGFELVILLYECVIEPCALVAARSQATRCLRVVLA